MIEENKDINREWTHTLNIAALQPSKIYRTFFMYFSHYRFGYRVLIDSDALVGSTTTCPLASFPSLATQNLRRCFPFNSSSFQIIGGGRCGNRLIHFHLSRIERITDIHINRAQYRAH
jgi:hypothetical protein